MGDRPPINPYAPTMETGVPIASGEMATESSEQIRFAGRLDVDSIRNTDQIALVIGLILGIGFAGVLAAAGISAVLMDGNGSFTGTFLVISAVFLLLAVWLFVHSQRKRPLRRFYWMSGLVQGILYTHRIDIQWEMGQASLSLPRLTPSADFVNQYGRLFVCRGVHCFIPFASVDPGAWIRLRSFRPRHSKTSGPIATPPEPPAGAMVWQCSRDEFVRDRERHQFTCEPVGLSRFVFCVCAVLCLVSVSASSRPPLTTVASFAGGMFISGLLWSLREGVRRNWRFRLQRRTSLWRSTDASMAADYPRWMTDDALMIGFADGWFCLPWPSIYRAVVSQYGVEFYVSTEKIDAWFMERGDRSDDQWQEIIEHVSARIPGTRCFGSVRHPQNA